MNELKPIENINKNRQNFPGISDVQKKVPPSHELQEYAYESQNSFKLKEDSSQTEIAWINWCSQVFLT